MSRFLKVKTAGEILDILKTFKPLAVEKVGLDSACNRVLAFAVNSPEPLPHFDRATMDGYAVKARDTFGASETLPAFLGISGEATMGEEIRLQLESGRVIAVPTGGMLPRGADAIVMEEYTHYLDEKTIEVFKPVAPGDNMVKAGEEIGCGDRLFPHGWRLRVQDVGLLAALGVVEVAVYSRPRVAIISTGDEIVPAAASAALPLGKVRDINSFTLAAMIRQAGAEVSSSRIVQDDLDQLVAASKDALEKSDALLLSGGSSVGVRDFTLKVLDYFPDSELLAHGVAIRPGKPTILARIGKKVFWGLPGQPVSALMICRAFVLPSLAILEGCPDISELEGNSLQAILQRQLPSVHGRTDYIPVMLSAAQGQMWATPVFGKSAMISMLAKANGYVVVPEHSEGVERGSEVKVYLFSQ